MTKITVGELLDELDGSGIIWQDSDMTGEGLKKLGLSHETEINTFELKDSSSTQCSNSWFSVWDLCISLGMETGANKTGQQDVLDFIKELYEEANS